LYDSILQISIILHIGVWIVAIHHDYEASNSIMEKIIRSGGHLFIELPCKPLSCKDLDYFPNIFHEFISELNPQLIPKIME